MTHQPAASASRPVHPSLAMRADLEDRAALVSRFEAVRSLSLALTRTLSPEDMQPQSMPDASPVKWHLAHTTWFFETFLCQPWLAGYEPRDPRHAHLFNSYYEAVGSQWSRPHRGLLTRPPLSSVLDYRGHVEDAVRRLADTATEAVWSRVAPLLELGLHHEQQHQELICTDVKHLFAQPPEPEAAFDPALAPHPSSAGAPGELAWIPLPDGVQAFGHDPAGGFAFDCEGPPHERLLHPAEIAARPVTNGEFLAFIEDGGYRNARFWLSDGWAWVQETGASAPLYWRRDDGGWREYTLHGLVPLDPARPVCHVSGYEAAAYAEWAGARLPTEFELERLARMHPVSAPALRDGSAAHPEALTGVGAEAVFGGVWEWSSSAFERYPGYRPPEGAVGEYNGKFMSGQLVLRGGSCATPEGHVRPTYRNFFPPNARWQFTGLRLARPAG